MRRQQIITLALLLIGAIYAISQAVKPDTAKLRFDVHGDRAYGYGYTDDWSVDYIKRFTAENPEVKTLVLKSMAGTRDADMNLRVARHIRRAGLNTHLETDSYIASGAVDLFLAGVDRTMECGAKIGVHSWTLGKTLHPAEMGSDKRQIIQEKFLTEMGIDPAFYVFTRNAARPENIYILTPDDINRFNLLPRPLECQ